MLIIHPRDASSSVTNYDTDNTMLYLVVGNRVRRLDNAKAIDRIGYKQNTHTLVSEYSSSSTHLIPGTNIQESWTRWRRNKVVPARRRCDRQYYKRKPKPSPPKTGSLPAKTNKTSFIGQERKPKTQPGPIFEEAAALCDIYRSKQCSTKTGSTYYS